MASLPAAPPIDVERFYALTRDWPHQAELLDGEIVVNPAPSPYHQAVLLRLAQALDAWARSRRPPPTVLPAPVDVRLDDVGLAQPDVTVWLAGLDLRAQPSPPPDLAVEVLSPSTRRRDVEHKRRLYARAGIAELWLVDPDELAVTTLRDPVADDYRSVDAARGSTDLTSPLLPGLTVSVPALFP